MKNKKQYIILEAARELFWKHGLKKVSVEEICQKAGISKMTFYRHFPNKTVLAKAVYDQVAEEGAAKFKTIMSDEYTSSHEKMEQILRLKMEGTHEISREFLEDFYKSPELGLSAYIEDRNLQIWLGIIEEFKMAQEKGWFRKDFKPEAFLIMVNKFTEFFTDEKLINLYSSPQEMIMEISRLFTYGIMPLEEHFRMKK